MPSTIPGLIDWPFAPGEGPFHVKGIAYRGHQKFIDEHVPGGYLGILEQLDPELRRFYSQPFLAACWYDLAPLVLSQGNPERLRSGTCDGRLRR